jgi:deazaflavin-dependent oxidoreductase (nitroreductase family)
MLMQLATLAGALFVGVVAIALVFLLGMRAKSALVLNPLIRLQRAILNPREMRSAGTPGAYASVIRHRGRISGRPYETPVGAVAADDGFVIALPYGSRTQWLKNVVASASATIVHEGHTYQVDQPEIIPMQAAESRFTTNDQRSFRWLAVDQALRVRRVEPGGAGERLTDAPRGEGAIHEPCTVVRDFRPEDRDDAIRVLAASFQGFGPLDQVVGDDDKAQDRRRSMYEMVLKEGTKQTVIVAERDGGIEGVLTYADRPDCVPSARDSLAAVRIAGPRLLPLIRDFRIVDKAHPRTPHRHLPALGVRPEAQGQGIGGLLMSEYARRCDEAGLEGYLETVRWADPSRRAQERLYERHGFAVAEVVPMTDDWSMVTMRRPAATTSGG